jgi:hypothetical protein
MKKLKLDLDRIQVVSFSLEAGARSRGTVNGLSDTGSFVSPTIAFRMATA